MNDNRQSIFKQYAAFLLPEITPFSTKESNQLPLLLDTLCRKKHHHIALLKSSSDKYNEYFIETLAHQLSLDTTPSVLQGAQCIYFDVTSLMLHSENKDDIENDWRIFLDEAEHHQKTIIFILDQLELFTVEQKNPGLAAFSKLLKNRLDHPQWRFIVLNNQALLNDNPWLNRWFTPINIQDPTEADTLGILKHIRPQLEHDHHITLSEETLASALSLATTYLAGASSLDKTLELIESAGARINSLFTQENTEQKPVLTTAHLALVVSSWTHIPSTHLQTNKFLSAKLIESLKKHIFGQDAALQSIAHLLQNACIKLQKNKGPLCSFLLTGPEHTGKSTLAHALAEQLFGHKNAVLHVENHAAEFMDLFTAIEQMPYGILFFENLNSLSPDIAGLLDTILKQGYVISPQGKKYDFSHNIVIISTHHGSEQINKLLYETTEQNKQMDLVQLVLNEHIHTSSTHPSLSPQKLLDCLTPELALHFPKEWLDILNIIPCLPLDYPALEKVMNEQLKNVSKQLAHQFQIEFHYAPEVIQFLAHEAFWQKEHTSLKKIMEQYLYSCVINELLTFMEHHQKPKRLSLHLNDNGQLLRCEFTMAATASITYP